MPRPPDSAKDPDGHDASVVVIERMSADAAVAATVSALIEQVVKALPYYNERAKREEIAKYTPELLEEQIADDPDSVLVAWSGTTAVGFCLSRYDDGPVWLSWFGVAESARRLGIGRRLVIALLETLAGRGSHKLWCDTRTDNTASQALLTELGFERVGHVTNHWYGQDFYLWERYPS